MKRQAIVRQTMSLPVDAVDFLDRMATENFTSRNAEVVRSVRERMKAATGEGLVNRAPAAADETGALTSAVSINHG